MKRFISLTAKKIKDLFFKTDKPDGLLFFEKGKRFYKLHQFEDALNCLNSAVDSGFGGEAYELRAVCYQKMNFHETAIEDFDKAIENNPLKFSSYYGRALSKKAISDYAGQTEDLQNTLHYYSKKTVLDGVFLKELETEFLSVKTNLDQLPLKIRRINRRSIIEMKLLVRKSLRLITKSRFGNLNTRRPTERIDNVI